MYSNTPVLFHENKIRLYNINNHMDFIVNWEKKIINKNIKKNFWWCLLL